MSNAKSLDIIFDGPPSHVAGRFVEVEVEGKSVGCGNWEKRDDGYWALRITAADLNAALCADEGGGS